MVGRVGKAGRCMRHTERERERPEKVVETQPCIFIVGP